MTEEAREYRWAPKDVDPSPWRVPLYALDPESGEWYNTYLAAEYDSPSEDREPVLYDAEECRIGTAAELRALADMLDRAAPYLMPATSV